MRRLLVVVLSCLVVLPLAGTGALGHDERDASFPSGEAGVPAHRQGGPTLVVCKPDSLQRIAHLPAPLREWNERLAEDCDFEHIQAAVDAVEQPGTRILVLPGVYREEPSLEAARDLSPECEQVLEETSQDGGGEDGGDNARGTAVLSYEQQFACPHIHNLIAILGDGTPADDSRDCDLPVCRLQIEGTGVRPEDVVVDGQFRMLNGIRGDRADGLYLRNFAVQRFEFNSVYVVETDGVVFDSMLARWNDEYGLLSFADDHVLYENCEGYGNGDGALYPGSASDILSDAGLLTEVRDEVRFATEIRACRGHHSTLGYSGTAGNAVWTHHTEFDHNIVGATMDSLFPGHPGLPQDHALFERNLFHENNNNYYTKYLQQGVCQGPFSERGYDDGVVCPVVPVPVGTGSLVAGGNLNLFQDNRYYDNWRMGHFQFWVAAALRDENDPSKQFDTSHFNTHIGNVLAENPRGSVQPQGFDFVWDGEGEGNCWQDNTSAAGEPTYAFDFHGPPAPDFPDCDPRPPFTPAPTIAVNADCARFDRDSNPEPEGCTWFEDPEVPAGREPADPTLQRLAGKDRYATAVLASQEGYPSGAPAVVVARGDLYPDALAAAPLAAAAGGPLLLTTPGSLHPATRAEVARLGATRAIVVGGSQAVAPAVTDALRDLGIDDVVRVAGTDRYDTAARIARLVGGAHVFLAKGDDPDPRRAWPDALAASSVAATLGRPVLLTAPGGLSTATAAYLDEGLVTDLKLVGGTAALPAAIEEAVASRVEQVERIAGDDRYGTSLALAQYAIANIADPTELWLATGTDWPDGIAAGASVAVDEGVLLLVPDELGEDAAARRWLAEQDPFSVDSGNVVGDIVEGIRVLGGTAAVPAAVTDALRDDFGAVDGDARGDRSNGTTVTVGSFAPLPGAPSGYGAVAGTAVMERRLDGTTRARVYVAGLPTSPGTAHPVHVHARSCDAEENPHFAFDPSGPAEEPNEIHPGFRTQVGGVGVGDSTVMDIAGKDAVSVVIHAPDGTVAACADLA